MERKSVKWAVWAALFLIISGAVLCFVKIGKGAEKQKTISQEKISDEILRFHIRADSDKEEDQKLKITVKNQMVTYLQWLLKDCSSKESCKKVIEKNIKKIEEIGQAVCKKEGQQVEVRAYLTKETFPLKQYGDMVLPSGSYDALRVDLGKGEGKNWWCMMYPSLCLVGGVVTQVPEESQKELKETLGKEGYESLFLQEKKEEKIHFKWKIKELWEQWEKKSKNR